MEIPYTLFTDTSCYAYPWVLIQAVTSPEDLRPIAYISGSFSDMQQRWSATEKEVYAVYQSVLKFDLYLRGEKCVLCCDLKLLEPFLCKGIKLPKLSRWSIELADYNTTFVHIKGKKNFLCGCYLQVKNTKYLPRTIGESKNISN